MNTNKSVGGTRRAPASHARARVALACAASVLSGVLPARAADSNHRGMSTYVSDEFKTVAVRLLRQFATSEIRSVCPSDKPVCAAVVASLANAFAAAVKHDQPALQKTLSAFFIASSSNALLQVSAGDLLEAEDLGAPRAALVPLMRCLSAAVSGQSIRTACSLSDGEKAQLEAEAQKLAGGCTSPYRGVCEYTVPFLEALKGKRLDPASAVRVLATYAEQPRPDLSIYLKRVAGFLDEGVDDGLWAPAKAFLLKEEDPAKPARAIRNLVGFDGAHPAGHLLWVPEATCTQAGFSDASSSVRCDEVFAKALRACGAAESIWNDWTQARDHGSYVARMREHFIRSEPFDLTLLQRLLDVQRTCTAPEASAVGQLQRYVRFAIAPLTAYRAIRRAAVPGLATAALLDYLRNQDEVALNSHVRWTLLYGVGELLAQMHNAAKMRAESAGGPRVAFADWVTPAAALDGDCEGRAAAALLGFTPNEAKVCYSLASGRREAATQWGPAPASGPSAEWLAVNAPKMLAVVEPAIDRELGRAESAGWLVDVDAKTLQHALQQFAGGQLDQSRQMVLRVGVDLLVETVDSLTNKVLGGDEKSCTESLRSTTIFSGVGSSCAVHLLILGAYRPIADYYWQSGINEQNASELSTSVFTNLLESPALNSTPIILNVGLGGNLIYGARSAWGDHFYAAATIIDKIGLAFYKTTSERWRFETGPFAGGFLDALIRTAASEGKEQRYWLLGYTVGFTRMWGADLGFEAHVGAAMPFTFSAGERYAAAAGAALVVPFDLVFNKED